MKMANFLLGADFGTSGVKALLLNAETGEKIGSKVYEYPTIHQEPLWAEQIPQEYWNSFCKACKELIALSGIRADEIKAIGLSSQGHGLIAIDEAGSDLGNNMIWMDSRAEEQCAYIRDNFGNLITDINFNPIKVLFAIPEILWEQQHRPEKYRKTVKYLGVSSYINYLLTGVFSVNPSEGSQNYCFDTKRHCWNSEIAEKLKIPLDMFSNIYECHQFIGAITEEAARATGLHPGTKVIGGGHDTTSAAFATGVVEPGQAFYSMGTGGNLGVITRQPVYHEAMTVQCYVIPDMWILDAVMNSTGQSMKWFSQQFGQMENLIAGKLGIGPYEMFDLEAKKSPAGNSGVVYTPYLAGESSPIWDENARAALVGITSRTTRGDTIRAIMEGVCFSAYHNMTIFEEIGSPINEFIVCGGPAKSQLWMQILADITGKVVRTTENEDAAPLGDAMLAGVACGLFKDFKQAAERNVKIRDSYHPNLQNKKIYDRLFEVYLHSYKNMRDDYHRISDF
jgi:xylulokinase